MMLARAALVKLSFVKREHLVRKRQTAFPGMLVAAALLLRARARPGGRGRSTRMHSFVTGSAIGIAAAIVAHEIRRDRRAAAAEAPPDFWSAVEHAAAPTDAGAETSPAAP